MRVNWLIDFMILWMKLVAKKGDPDMHDTSRFLKEGDFHHDYFGVLKGWVGVNVMVKDEEVV